MVLVSGLLVLLLLFYNPQVSVEYPAKNFAFSTGATLEVVSKPFVPNPYWPLVPGTTYDYVVQDAQGNHIEQTKMEVKQKTIEILGINCIVVRDRVWAVDEEDEHDLIEDTDDWYAQDKQGNVWHFGEEVKDYENGVLISIDGSFQAGRGFDKAGIIMLAHPQVGDYYRQEFSLGNAEDVSENLEIIDTLQGRRCDVP